MVEEINKVDFNQDYYSKINSRYELWIDVQHRALDWGIGLSTVIVAILFSTKQYPDFWTAAILMFLLVILSAIFKRAVIAHYRLRNYLQLSKNHEQLFMYKQSTEESSKKEKKYVSSIKKMDDEDIPYMNRWKYVKKLLAMGFLPIFAVVILLLFYNLVISTINLLNSSQYDKIIALYVMLCLTIFYIIFIDFRYLRKKLPKIKGNIK